MEGRAGGHRFSSTDLLLRRHVIASGISRAATVLPESRGAAALRLHWEVADSPLFQEDAGREREEPILSHCAAEEPLTCRIWRGVGRQWHPDEEELKKPVVGGLEGGGAAPLEREGHGEAPPVGKGHGEAPPVGKGHGEAPPMGKGHLEVGGGASLVGREEGRRCWGTEATCEHSKNVYLLKDTKKHGN
uniref:Uncharacterized protein n=2 Tax=Oryza sativa subsp. japonica TaxID=39947 RepID=Q53LL6_ORYSJ|nr:hypothetical protein LOC_Os11g09780 [Oryza sativa Japonica Group]AAX96364.1 hypothetical protein [Oryza sativa Japonica Group]ABA91968.1 hypothetical protein LOC_Os11g09780 [Oryza sativa Japonica Group]